MDAQETVEKWIERSRRIQSRHYDASAALLHLHYRTGIPLVVLSVIEGSTLLASAAELVNLSTHLTLITGSVGLLIALLAAVQAFMSFETRSRLHYLAGAKYGALKRQLEAKQLISSSGPEVAKYLGELAPTWNALTEDSPPIPLSIWRKGRTRASG